MTTWATPRTWSYNELVDELMLNTHLRDQLLSLKNEHFGRQSLRGARLRTHPDNVTALSKVQLLSA